MADGSQPPGLIARVAQASRFIISGVAPDTWMSPNQPLKPMAPPDVKGRQWDYPVALNLRYQPRTDEPINFARLRLLAENCNVLRTVIQRQKELIEAFEWQIKPREDTPGHRPTESKFAGPVREITEFLRIPDRVHDWPQWLHMLLEEALVIDAVAIYRRPTMDGSRLWGLEIISGDTITPMIDATGRTPQAPSVAYQQILKGVPAADFTLEELIYYPKSPRANRLYGYPPVQWIISTVEASIERLKSQKAYFTEGNLIDTVFTAPEGYTTDQITVLQSWWDDLFAGNVEARRQGRWLPHGTVVDQSKEPLLKDEFDEWLARVICFAYSTSPLPFVKALNRGNQDSQQEVAEEGGIAPWMQYVKRMMDKVITEDLQHPELEFTWVEDREFDPMIAAQIQDLKLKSAGITFNEYRDKNGDDPYDGEWADTPIMLTATGPVPIQATVERAIKDAEAPPPDPMGLGVAGGGGPPGMGVSGGPKPAPANDAKPAPKEAMAKARRRPAVPLETRSMKRAVPKVRSTITGVLKTAGADVKEQVRRKLLMMQKADGDDPAAEAEEIVSGLDLTSLDPIAEGIEAQIGAVAEEAGHGALVQIGVSDHGELVNQVATRATIWARNRSAELVGKRWTADGQLIDNPDARWAIDQSTRDMLRTTIADGLAANRSVPEIADDIEGAYPFSRERADLIAHTEIRRANVEGSLEGAREAREIGVVTRKVWLLGQEPCDICLDNADEGPIDLDDDFPSGDSGPPAHPNCYCSLSWDISDLEDDGGD